MRKNNKTSPEALETQNSPILCEVCHQDLGLTGEFWDKYKKAKMAHVDCKNQLNQTGGKTNDNLKR